MSTAVASSFPATRAVLRAAGATLDVRDRTGSTNTDLLAAAAGAPHLATIATLDQTAGRGRLDRTWSAPAGETLAASVLVRADLADRDRGWLPLVAGAAMRHAIAGVLAVHGSTVCDDGTDADDAGRASRSGTDPDDGTDADDAGRASRPGTDPVGGPRDVVVKWPNDVLLGGRKVCGILCQVAPDGAVVVGAGVNLTIPADRLPTPTATSLAVAGAHGDAADLADAVLSAFCSAVLEAVAALVAGGAAAQAVRSDVRSVCGTIGRAVRLDLPDGSAVEAEATGIDDDGRITIRRRDGVEAAVAVGDVTHLRYA